MSVADPSATAPGRLVNGTFALASPLGGLGVVKTYAAPVSNDVVTVTFSQAISSTEPLRTGTYSKALTFTLSTTTTSENGYKYRAVFTNSLGSATTTAAILTVQ